MKYNIFGLSQEKLIEFGLSLDDALVLERLQFFNGYFPEEKINGKSFKWISYTKLKEEIPLVATSDDKLTRIMKKLEEIGILERFFKRSFNKTKVYFHFTDKMWELMGQKCGVSTNPAEVRSLLTPQVHGSTNPAEVRSESSGIESSGSKSSGITALKLFDQIKDFFSRENVNYYHDGKQAKAVKNIEVRFKEWEKVEPLFRRFKYMREHVTYWSNVPLTAHDFYASVDRILVWKEGKIETTGDEAVDWNLARQRERDKARADGVVQ